MTSSAQAPSVKTNLASSERERRLQQQRDVTVKPFQIRVLRTEPHQEDAKLVSGGPEPNSGASSCRAQSPRPTGFSALMTAMQTLEVPSLGHTLPLAANNNSLNASSRRESRRPRPPQESEGNWIGLKKLSQTVCVQSSRRQASQRNFR